MKFLSIKEFFYKLNTIGFILLLLPMVTFTFLEYWTLYHPPLFRDPEEVNLVLMVTVIILLIDLTIVHWVWAFRAKRLASLIELARKMDGYFSLNVMKMVVYNGGSLMAAAGFYLTSESWFTWLFLALSITIGAQWPSPERFCHQFALRGSERDMVLNNRDLFQKNRQAGPAD